MNLCASLTVSLDQHLRQCAALHSRLCPRQVIGVRMARFACRYLSIDPALERKRIFVYMEIGRCAADGVMVVTYASPMNHLMQLIPYGKVAATFVDLRTGSAIRVSEHPQSRSFAEAMSISAVSTWEKQRAAYQIMPDDHLLRWNAVHLTAPTLPISEKHRVTCDQCGERINEQQEVTENGRVLCKGCAFGAYYSDTSTAVSCATSR